MNSDIDFEQQLEFERSNSLAWLLAALWVAVPGAASAEGLSLDRARPKLERFSTHENALPDDGVLALALLPSGRLLVSTFGGLVEFDGVQWRPSPIEMTLGGATITAVATAPEGDQWFATSSAGLWHQLHSQWAHYTVEQGLGANTLVAVAATSGAPFGEVCAAASTLVSCFDGKRWASYPLPKDVQLNRLAYASSSRRLWVGTNHGLFYLESDRLESGSPLGDIEVLSLSVIGDGLWVGTHDGARRIVGAQVTHFTAGLPSQTVWAIAAGQTKDAAIWLSTDRGLARLEGDRVEAIRSTPFGRAPSFPQQLLVDEVEGRDSLWLGDGERGLFRITLSPFRHFAADDPKGNAAIQSLGGQSQRGLFFYRKEQGLFRVDLNSLEVSALPSPAKDDEVTALATAGSQLLAGTRLGRVFRGELDAGGRLSAGWKSEPRFPVEDRNGILSLRVGPKTSELWVGRVQGVVHVTGEAEEPKAALAPPAVDYSFVIDSGGDSLWVTIDDHGLARFRGGGWKLYSKESGHLASNSLSAGIYQQRQGKRFIWVAHKEGLTRLRLDEADEPVEVLHLGTRTAPAMPQGFGFIYAMLASGDGDVWASTNKGLVRFSGLGPDRVRHYTVDDGLPSNLCNTNGLFEDGLGRIWVGTNQGLGVLDPTAATQLPTAASVELRQWLVNGVAAATGAPRSLDHLALNHRFEFGIRSLFRAQDTLYQSQLTGLDPGATAWASSAAREFTTLPAGSYEFRVWAKDYLGRVSSPASVSFAIATPPWRRWWAIVGYFLAAALMIAGTVRARIRQLNKRAEQLEQLVDKRTEELKQRADELVQKNSELEESHRQADRIFAALKQAIPGTTLGDKFLISDQIGEGGFGAVYLATEVRTGKKFAAKVFKPQAGNDSPEALERFKREAISAGQINHPNAVQVIEGGVSTVGLPYMIFELLVGCTLGAELKKTTQLSVARAIEILAPVCDALAAAHEQNVVHRDIKPENIYLHRDPQGREVVKVLDFGIAKIQDDERPAQSLTISGSIVGTPSYIAPERLADRPYDGRSDVYALAVVAYECLVGRPPFSGNFLTVSLAHLNKAPQPLRELVPTVSEGLERLILDALSKDPARRPSAQAFGARLRELKV